jgi:hypothetical protein
MLFASSDRFKGTPVTHPNGDLQAFRSDKEETDHVGPGVYYNAKEDEVRGGWKKKSFSSREPMSRPNRQVDRSHHYTNGEMISFGIALPRSPEFIASPGPGHYGTSPLSSSLIKPSPNKKLNVTMTTNNTHASSSMQNTTHLMGSTPRISPMNTVVRDGVLFVSTEHPSSLPGPGQYASPNAQSNLIKKSFNARASPSGSAARSRPRSAQSPKTSGGSSPFSPKIQKSTSISARHAKQQYTSFDDESYRVSQ